MNKEFILNALTWLGTIITIVSFAMYLLDVTNLLDIKNVHLLMFLIIVIISIAFSMTFAYITKERYNKREIHSASSIMGDMGYKIQTLNNELYNLKTTKEKWHETQLKMFMALPSDATQIRKELTDYLGFRLEKINAISFDVRPSLKDLEIISKTKIPVEEINAFYNTVYPNSILEIKEFYLKLKTFEKLLLTTDFLNKAIENEFGMLQVSGEMFYFSFLELVAEMPQSVNNDFYELVAPFLIQLPSVKMLSKEEAKNMADRSYNQYQSLMNEYASIVGSKELSTLLLKEDLIRLLRKIEINKTMEVELDVKKKQLKQAQEVLYQNTKLNKEESMVDVEQKYSDGKTKIYPGIGKSNLNV